VMNIYFDSTIA